MLINHRSFSVVVCKALILKFLHAMPRALLDALIEGFDCVLIEREDEYVRDIKNRFKHYVQNRKR